MSALPEFAWNEPDPKSEWRDANRRGDPSLQQAQKLEAMGRLSGAVAHDFNNLLTGIMLYCDLLLANLEPDAPAEDVVTLKRAESDGRTRKYAEEIRKASLQGANLIRQLLAVARPAQMATSLIFLNQIVEQMHDLLTRLIGENIDLKFELDPALGRVRMTPTEAQQILLNLALNARDAMPGGGRIVVETRACTIQVLPESRIGNSDSTLLPCALLVVSDNGCGMDSVTREHLFEAFFTTKAAGKGNGLGLATIHEIVTRNGGLIHVDSAPARGTRIKLLLPLVPEAPSSSQFQSSQLHLYAQTPDSQIAELSRYDFHPPLNEGVLPAREKEKTP